MAILDIFTFLYTEVYAMGCYARKTESIHDICMKILLVHNLFLLFNATCGKIV